MSPACEIATAAETAAERILPAAGGRWDYSKRTTAGQADSEMHELVGKLGLSYVNSTARLCKPREDPRDCALSLSTAERAVIVCTSLFVSITGCKSDWPDTPLS